MTASGSFWEAPNDRFESHHASELVPYTARPCLILVRKKDWYRTRVPFLGGICPGRKIAFCADGIMWPDEPLVIDDLQQDPRFRDSALVTHAPHLRFLRRGSAGPPGRRRHRSLLHLLTRADQALYEEKRKKQAPPL